MDSIVPVYDSRAAQKALVQWELTRRRVDGLQDSLAKAEAALEAARKEEEVAEEEVALEANGSATAGAMDEAGGGGGKEPLGFWAQQQLAWRRGRGAKLQTRVEKLRGKLHAELSRLERQRQAWEGARREALAGPPLPAFFVTFYSQQAAWFASQSNTNPEQMRLLKVSSLWCCA